MNNPEPREAGGKPICLCGADTSTTGIRLDIVCPKHDIVSNPSPKPEVSEEMEERFDTNWSNVWKDYKYNTIPDCIKEFIREELAQANKALLEEIERMKIRKPCPHMESNMTCGGCFRHNSALDQIKSLLLGKGKT